MYRQHQSRILILSFVLALGISVVAGQDPLSKNYRFELEEIPSGLLGISPTRHTVTGTQRGNRTVEHSVLEGPSINGGYKVILEVSEEVVRVDDQTTHLTRQEFGTDPDGGRKLLRSIEEEHSQLADGDRRVVRNFFEPDLNGQLKNLRRELQHTASVGSGIDRTQIEILTSDINQRGLIATGRIEQTERREGQELLEIDRVTYTNHRGGAEWQPLERHITQHEYGSDETRTVEQIFQPDGSQNLSLSQRILHRRWTDREGREQRTEEHYNRDVPGFARSSEPLLYRKVQETRRNRPDGSSQTIREVQELQVDRFRVVERMIEEEHVGSGGSVETEQQHQKLDLNGNLETVQVSRTRQQGN